MEKNKSASLVKSASLADPWQAFLLPSVPHRPLIEFGCSALATAESVGPNNALNLGTAFSPTSSNPVTTSLYINKNT